MLVIVLRTTGRKHQKWFGSLALQLSKLFLFPPQCYVVCLNFFSLVHVKVIIQSTLQLPRIVTCFALMSRFILMCPQLFFALRLWQVTHSCHCLLFSPSMCFLTSLPCESFSPLLLHQKFHCPKSSISQKILPIFKWICSFTIL